MTKPYASGDRVHFNYLTKGDEKKGKLPETIEVIGVVAPNSGNIKKETSITVLLDTPRNGRPYLGCDINRITEIEKFTLVGEPKLKKRKV